MNAQTEIWPKPHRLTVDDYYLMVKAGVLSPDNRTELIEGEILDMAPIGSARADVVTLLTERLSRAVGKSAAVRTQRPLRLSTRSEPQPDVALVQAKRGGYRRGHPTPGDVLLLIEVSDTTRQFDLNIKARLYSMYDIPEYWVVDLVGNRVWRHRNPGSTVYGEREKFAAGKLAVPEGLGEIAIAELF